MGTFQIPGTTGLPAPVSIGLGAELNGAFVLPAGGKVFYVRGDGTTPTYYDDTWNKLTAKDMCGGLYPSVALALGQCTANRGDRIIVLPNHTENLATAASWTFVNGVQILCLGQGATRPTFTFSAAASTLVVNKTGVRFSNARFLCAGPAGTTALTVAAPLTIAGEGFCADVCYFEIGIDADQLCTDFCNISAANAMFYGNEIRGLAQASTPTSCFTLTGANYARFIGNHFKAALSAAAKGFIANSTTASGDILVDGNTMWQWKSDSSACISLAANSVTTGIIKHNRFRVMDNASVNAVVYSGTGVDVALYDNHVANVANETGILNQGTVSAAS